MKIYVGIHVSNQFLYIAALDSSGVAILKNQYPLYCHPNIIADALLSIKSAFNATLKIAVEKNKDINPALINTLGHKFGDAQVIDPFRIYSTDLIPEDKLDFTIYRISLNLAILRSLAD